MKKMLCAFAVLFFMHAALHAQDTIYKNDGSLILAKVLEVSTTVIKYKRYTNLDGPNYTVYKSDVSRIVYENGEKEVFNQERETEETVVMYETNYYEENESKKPYDNTTIMGQDVFQFYYRNISFFVETRTSQVFAMRYSFYFNFNKEVERPGFPIQYGASVYPSFAFYTNKYVRVFAGPHFLHGFSWNDIWVQVDEEWDPIQGEYVPIYGDESRFRWHTMFLAEPGVSINPVKNFDITIHGGVGFNTVFYREEEFEGIDTAVEFAWKIGVTIGGRW